MVKREASKSLKPLCLVFLYVYRDYLFFPLVKIRQWNMDHLFSMYSCRDVDISQKWSLRQDPAYSLGILFLFRIGVVNNDAVFVQTFIK